MQHMLNQKNLAKLKQKKYRQLYKQFMIEGSKSLVEAIDSPLEIEQILYTPEWTSKNNDLIHSRKLKPIKKIQVSYSQLKSLADSQTPQGVIAIANIPDYPTELMTQAKTLVALEDVRDPGNLGTIIRTCDWFGVDGLILLDGADPFQPKVVRSSMGSICRLPIWQTNQGIQQLKQLKEQGFQLISTQLDGQNLKQFTIQDSTPKIIIFGNEARGVSENIAHLADVAVTIPKHGQAESLNLAVSCGIVLEHLV